MNCQKTTDELYMRRCLQLARNGAGSTSPNPLVGAIIVYNNRIIGEGYHIRAGEPHAEVNAVNSVKISDRSLLCKSTMYVTLEPCSHYGKTPPCCELIISCGIPRVVIATTDFNLQVNGKGIERMQKCGIEVVTGTLKDDSICLNNNFFTFHRLSRPYITLKWAQTADGFIDFLRKSGTPLAISKPESLTAVHKLRAQHDAILVGTNTALLDNPSLTLRYWCGRHPLRLVIDRDGILPPTLHLFDNNFPTVVFTQKKIEGKFRENVSQITLDFSHSILPQILDFLVTLKKNSLLVEGGASLLQSFIDSDLWDAARVERNPNIRIGNGVPAPQLPHNTLTGITRCFGHEIYNFTR